MRRTLLLTICVIGLATLVASSVQVSPVQAVFQSSSTTPIYTMQSTQYGVFAVKESTGAITFCANNTVIPQPTGGTAPSGACKALGTVTPTAASNNSLSMTVSGISVFVFNNQTGQVSQCAGSGVLSGSSVNPVASCKALPNLN